MKNYGKMTNRELDAEISERLGNKTFWHEGELCLAPRVVSVGEVNLLDQQAIRAQMQVQPVPFYSTDLNLAAALPLQPVGYTIRVQSSSLKLRWADLIVVSYGEWGGAQVYISPDTPVSERVKFEARARCIAWLFVSEAREAEPNPQK